MTLTDWGCVLGAVGLLAVGGLLGALRRLSRRPSPRVHLLGSAATHPLPDVRRPPLTAADWDQLMGNKEERKS